MIGLPEAPHHARPDDGVPGARRQVERELPGDRRRDRARARARQHPAPGAAPRLALPRAPRRWATGAATATRTTTRRATSRRSTCRTTWSARASTSRPITAPRRCCASGSTSCGAERREVAGELEDPLAERRAGELDGELARRVLPIQDRVHLDELQRPDDAGLAQQLDREVRLAERDARRARACRPRAPTAGRRRRGRARRARTAHPRPARSRSRTTRSMPCRSISVIVCTRPARRAAAGAPARRGRARR